MKLNQCTAQPVRCKYMANADKVIVCSAPMGEAEIEGKIYKVPLDSRGGICPFFHPIEVNDLGFEEVIS